MMNCFLPRSFRPARIAHLFGAVLLAGLSSAQVAMNVTGSYSQNFDTPALVNTGTNVAWTDNSTIANWYWQTQNVVAAQYDAGTGSSATGKRMSFGAALANDRAMGSLSSGTPGHLAHGVLLQNTSASTITDIAVTYTGEQWRNGNNLTAQNLSFYYQISGAPITALSPGSNGSWTNVAALNFTSPIATATAGALDGNAPANRVTFTSIPIPTLAVPAGSYIMLKWDDPNDAGNDHGMGIDDLTINWTVGAPTLTTSTISFGGVTTNSAVVNMSGGTGTGRILVARQGSAVVFTPTNTTSYAGANSDFTLGNNLGGGDILVYNASGTSVTVTGLSPSTTYHFATYDYDGALTYSTPVGTGSTTTAGPILYNTGTYTQNFNGLPVTGTITTTGLGNGPLYTSVPPVNASGMLGWQYSKIAGSGSDVTFFVNDGTSSSGGNYSFGTGAAADRAIGAVASGSATASFGAVIRNTSAAPYTSFTISYTGEQWRNGGSNIPNALAFSYSLNGSSISTGTYTTETSLDFISPVSSAVAVALDGNAPANQTAVSFTVNMVGNWLPGTDLIIRWRDFDDSGADDGLAVDGFSFSAAGAVAPTTQDHDITFTNVTTVGADIDWTNGDGAMRMVVLNTANSFTNPTDGSETTGSPVYGGGEQVVYVGGGATVSVSNLAPNTPYYARVYAYNGATASAVYNTSTAVLNPNTFTTATPVAPTQLVITSINGGVDPIQYSPPFFLNTFSVTVQSQDGSNSPQDVSVDTDVLLSLNFGNGTLGGTLTGTILAGTHEVTITGVTYTEAEANVSIDAARTSGDVLSTGTSADFTVLGVPTDLVFANVPATGLVGVPVATFQVQARRADSSVDTNYGGVITVSVLSGPGTIGGTVAVNAINGIASFTDITLSAAGQYQLEANASGIFAGSSSLIYITLPVTMTELVVPQYIGSKSAASTNANRTPFAVCVQFDNLVPNTSYDVRAGMALSSEASTTYGAGNIWNGTTYGTTTLTNTFVSDGTGSSGPYWIFIQPTGNGTRFDAGQIHNLRVSTMINGNASPPAPQFTGAKTITALDIATTARTAAITTDDGAYVRGLAGACVSGKFILVYDNVAGTGDPLSSFQAITTTPSDITVGNYSGHPAAIADAYKQSGTALIGDYPAVVPIGANNMSGVRRIETRNADNTIFGAITDVDGIWPGGADFTTIARRAVGTIGASDGLLAPDSDSDGTADCLDGCPNDPNKIAPGACGCGVADVPATYYADADNDGLGDPASPVPGFTCTVPPGAVANNTDPCPSIQNGNPGDACDDGNPNTVLDVLGSGPACSCAGAVCTTDLTIEFQMDGGSTLGWEIRQQGTNILVQQNANPVFLPSPGTFSENTCLPDGCYYLVVTDDAGDGMTSGGNSGGYVLRTTNPTNKRLIDNSNNFDAGFTSQIAGNGGFCLPLGNDRLITASTDRLDLRRGVNGTCSDKITADNTPNGTTGNVYQFGFFDPNGGLNFTYPASGTTSNQVSLTSLPALLDGELYNVRVRTRISPGVWRNWGAASRLRIDNTLGQCSNTALISDVTNPNVSCNKNITLPVGNQGNGNGNRVVAQPVTRFNANCVSSPANKYQFRFRIVAENVVLVVNGVGSNYFAYMTTGNGFQPCKPYEVEVRASFDGGTTWCTGGDPFTDLAPWGDVCTVNTVGNCFAALQGNMDHVATTELSERMSMYPNPNRGDQVMLNLSYVKDGVDKVSVDIYDTFGKRVVARTVAVQDGFVNTMLDLHGELAAGMYMVNVTAGDAAYTERLVIQQ